MFVEGCPDDRVVSPQETHCCFVAEPVMYLRRAGDVHKDNRPGRRLSYRIGGVRGICDSAEERVHLRVLHPDDLTRHIAVSALMHE